MNRRITGLHLLLIRTLLTLVGLEMLLLHKVVDDAQSGTVTGSTENIDTLIPANPSLTVTKTVVASDNDNDGKIGVGDTLTYTISIFNTGNQTLNDFSFTDTLLT